MPEDQPPTTPRYDEFIVEFTRNSRRIYGYIRTLAPDLNDANEVYQNVSLVLWNKFGDFSPSSNFFSWACQIALYEVRKLRDTKNRARMFSDESLDALSAEFQERDDNSHQRMEALMECLEKLPVDDRKLIDQRYFGDRKPPEIAQQIGRSLASVYRALSRIHDLLMTCVQRKLS
jgi:RNA polymerase sigma-70 factor (ECF subfamily)